MKIRALIVDDEPRARSRMRRLLDPHEDVVVVGEAENTEQALQKVLEARPDLVFLDVQMPGGLGTELAARLRDYLPDAVRPLVVFTTAHAEHAVEAFGLESLDYLLKPVERDRLAATLRRVRKEVWAGAAAPVSSRPPPEATLTGHHGASIEAVPIGAIEVLEVDDGVVFATTDDGERHRLSQSLAELEARLPNPPFLRVSRKAVVNIERVDRLSASDGAWDAVFDSGRRTRVSRRRTRALRDALGVE